MLIMARGDSSVCGQLVAILVAAGCNVREVSEWAGHNSVAITQLGNFPQAFTHLSLINAAINLNHKLDHGTDFVLRPASPSAGR